MTKICKACGCELPETEFRITKGSARVSTCNACITEKRAQMRYNRTQMGGVNRLPFPTGTSTARNQARSCV